MTGSACSGDWQLQAFSIAGHYTGAGMVLKNGSKIIRPIILVVLMLLFIKIVTDL